MPSTSVSTPPRAAPTASRVDQVAAVRVLAVSSSRGVVIFGSTALRAGMKAALITICSELSR